MSHFTCNFINNQFCYPKGLGYCIAFFLSVPANTFFSAEFYRMKSKQGYVHPVRCGKSELEIVVQSGA